MNDIKPEAKLITYLSPNETPSNEDIHIVKEVKFINNKYYDNIRIIKNFKRPFYITKDIFKNHKDKKESEELSKVDTYYSTQSQLYKNIAKRLNQPTFDTSPRTINKSPYLYGTSLDSRTYLKYLYMKNNNNFISDYRVGFFDIEYDMLKNEIIIISLISKKRLTVGILKSFADKIPNIYEKLNYLYSKYIPDNIYKKRLDIEFVILNTEIELIRYVMQKANNYDIDILTAWNVKYDITTIMEAIDKTKYSYADIFHYDKIPEKYKHFSFKEGKSVKKTEAGREIAIPIEERWHTIKSSTNYIIVDTMSVHRYIRAGGATVPGGYSLDNILKTEGVDTKLKFDSNKGFKGIEWHLNMIKNKPAEYIIYNIWDVMSMMIMDDKTKDLQVSFPVLSGVSHFDIFNSGPKRIIDALTFFYLERGRVLGVKDMSEENDKILGLEDWIVTLRSHMMVDNGLTAIKGLENIITNIRTYVYDLDSVSSYPSCTMAANVSKDTTHRELIAVAGVPKPIFKYQNINLLYGKTNAVEYCNTMYKMPSLFDLIKAKKENKIV